jgi:mercuric ion transport protein
MVWLSAQTEHELSEDQLLRIDAIGAAVAAIGCFASALVVLFGMLGLWHLGGVLDSVLLPALLIFVGLIVYAPITKSRGAAERAEWR